LFFIYFNFFNVFYHTILFLNKNKIIFLKYFNEKYIVKLIYVLESFLHKKYLSLQSIVDDKNLALIINKKNDKMEVICYDTSNVFNDFKSFIFKIENKKEAIDSIIFHGEIQYSNKAPLDAVSIKFAIANPNTSGINVLYPILGLISKIFYNDGTVYSDHFTGYIPSDDAKKVWNKFFSDNYWQIEKIMPVDDRKQKLTPSLLDDGKVHFPIEHEVIDIFKNKKSIFTLLDKLKKNKDNYIIDEVQESLDKINEFTYNRIYLNLENIDETINNLKSQQDEILKKILEDLREPVDWIFRLKESNDINTSSVQLLIKRSDEFIKKTNWIKSKKDFFENLKKLGMKYYIFSNEYRK
jgi:hypothetical protein